MKKVVMLMCWLLPCVTYAQEKTLDQNSYAELLKAYKSKSLTKDQVLQLALQAKEKKEDNVADSIALQFKEDYLNGEEVKSNLDPEVKPYILSFQTLFHLDDVLSRYLLKYPDVVDKKLASPGFSKMITGKIITNDVIKPFIKNYHNKSVAPDWSDVERQVRRYTEVNTAKALVLNAKLSWYKSKDDWPNIIKYQIEKIETNGIDTVGLGLVMLNNVVYEEIFMHSNDSAALNKGLVYMKLLLKKEPNHDSWLDTYANLLYKSGKKSEAMMHERRALEIARSRKDQGRIGEYTEILKKMEANHPTWR